MKSIWWFYWPGSGLDPDPHHWLRQIQEIDTNSNLLHSNRQLWLQLLRSFSTNNLCFALHQNFFLLWYIFIFTFICSSFWISISSWKLQTEVGFHFLFIFIPGIDKYVVEDTEEARSNATLYPKPLNVIEGKKLGLPCLGFVLPPNYLFWSGKFCENNFSVLYYWTILLSTNWSSCWQTLFLSMGTMMHFSFTISLNWCRMLYTTQDLQIANEL